MSENRKLAITLGQSFRQMLSARSVSVALCAIVVAVVAGPFGTLEALAAPARIAFWSVVVGLSLLIGALAKGLADWAVPLRPLWRRELVNITLMTVMFAPVVWLVSGIASPKRAPDPMMFLEIAFYVFVMVAAVSFIRIFMLTPAPPAQVSETIRQKPVVKVPSGIIVAPPEPRLLRRLSGEGKAPVIRIMASDHHVEVVTRQGTTKLRMRMADAIAEMEPVQGMYTHRSHWVVLGEIEGLGRETPQKIYARLRNGDLVPVSRKYRPYLEDAGVNWNQQPNPASVSDAQQAPSEPQPRREA